MLHVLKTTHSGTQEISELNYHIVLQACAFWLCTISYTPSASTEHVPPCMRLCGCAWTNVDVYAWVCIVFHKGFHENFRTRGFKSASLHRCSFFLSKTRIHRRITKTTENKPRPLSLLERTTPMKFDSLGYDCHVACMCCAAQRGSGDVCLW